MCYVHDVVVGGSFMTDREAAVARAAAPKLEATLRRRTQAQELIGRISLLRQVYMPLHEDTSLLADLGSAFKHAKESKAMFAAEPSLDMVSIQLKYEPWRCALLKAWRHNGLPGGGLAVVNLNESGLRARATRLHAVLVGTNREPDTGGRGLV